MAWAAAAACHAPRLASSLEPQGSAAYTQDAALNTHIVTGESRTFLVKATKDRYPGAASVLGMPVIGMPVIGKPSNGCGWKQRTAGKRFAPFGKASDWFRRTWQT